MNCVSCRSFVSFADHYEDPRLRSDHGFCVNRKSVFFGGKFTATSRLLCSLHGAPQRDGMMFGNLALGIVGQN